MKQMVKPGVLVALLALPVAVSAIEVDSLEAFREHHGRYAPGGDCARQPRIAIDDHGFTFEGGPALPAATRPEFAASYMGNFYEGISLFFFPYTTQPMPLLVTLNAGEKPGVLTVEAHDHDYPGGPKLPEQYRPYVAASPYLRCR